MTEADFVYTNGRIYTVDDEQPWVEAVAIADGRITAVGSSDDVAESVGPGTEIIDLEGAFVMPGIHDAHVHPGDVYKYEEVGFLVFPESLGPDEIAEALLAYATANPDREWIRAQKYGLAAFPGGKLTKDFLDPLLPDRPVIVYDSALHNAGANSVALERAGITRDTPDPPLGVIDRDPSTGEATGYLSETGIGLVGRHIPRVDTDSLRQGTVRALGEMTVFGITAFIDMMAFEQVYDVYRELQTESSLPFRIVAALAMNEYTDEVVTAEEASELVGRVRQLSTSQVDAGHFKFWADGTALSFTSLFVEPYTNDPSTHGEMTMTPGMKKRAIELLGSGLGGHFHATGDGTVREVLNLIAAARQQYPGQVLRAHIGHNQVVHPEDIPRYDELDVVAEFSPPMWFPTPVSPFIPEFIGDRADRWMPIKEMLDAGAMVAIGSDWPAGTPTADPWRSLEGLVTRRDPWRLREGQLGEPIDLDSALRAMTLGGAVAMGQEKDHGSLELGKYADMIVLDRDPTATPLDELHETVVRRTIFNGDVVYEA